MIKKRKVKHLKFSLLVNKICSLNYISKYYIGDRLNLHFKEIIEQIHEGIFQEERGNRQKMLRIVSRLLVGNELRSKGTLISRNLIQ
jgi:hypothetical protein